DLRLGAVAEDRLARERRERVQERWHTGRRHRLHHGRRTRQPASGPADLLGHPDREQAFLGQGLPELARVTVLARALEEPAAVVGRRDPLDGLEDRGDELLALLAHRPLNSGGRFSVNARGPSSASSLASTRPFRSYSSLKPSSLPRARTAISFAVRTA